MNGSENFLRPFHHTTGTGQAGSAAGDADHVWTPRAEVRFLTPAQVALASSNLTNMENATIKLYVDQVEQASLVIPGPGTSGAANWSGLDAFELANLEELELSINHDAGAATSRELQGFVSLPYRQVAGS